MTNSNPGGLSRPVEPDVDPDLGLEILPEDAVLADAASAQSQLRKEIADEVAKQMGGISPTNFGMAVQVQHGRAPNELLQKLNSEQLGKVLDLSDNDSKRDHVRFLVCVVGGLAGFLALVGMLLYATQAPLLKDVLTIFAVFVGGFGSGAAYAKRQK